MTTAEQDIEAIVKAVVQENAFDPTEALAWLVFRQVLRRNGVAFETIAPPTGIQGPRIRRVVLRRPGRKRAGPGKSIPLRIVREANKLLKEQQVSSIKGAADQLGVPYQSLWRAINQQAGKLEGLRLAREPGEDFTSNPFEVDAVDTAASVETPKAPPQNVNAVMREIAKKLGIPYNKAWRQAREAGVDKFISKNA